jgi:hypothetical protein
VLTITVGERSQNQALQRVSQDELRLSSNGVSSYRCR